MPIPESNGNSKYKTTRSCKQCQRQPSMGALMTPSAVGVAEGRAQQKQLGQNKSAQKHGDKEHKQAPCCAKRTSA